MTQKCNINLNILKTEPAEDYHSRAKEYLSSHQLIDFINCPKMYHKKQVGMIENQQTVAMLLGSAAHCRILEGRDAYESQFAVSQFSDKRTKQYKIWASDQVDKGKKPLSQADGAMIENLASGVLQNDEAVDLLLYGKAEGVVRSDGFGVPCQIRIDWTNPHRGIVDLKTCDTLDRFEWTAQKFRYHNQLAFYQSVLAEVVEDYVPVYIIAVEKAEPYRCGVWRLSNKTLNSACRENQKAIEMLLRCHEVGHWPTLYEQIRILEVS